MKKIHTLSDTMRPLPPTLEERKALFSRAREEEMFDRFREKFNNILEEHFEEVALNGYIAFFHFDDLFVIDDYYGDTLVKMEDEIKNAGWALDYVDAFIDKKWHGGMFPKMFIAVSKEAAQSYKAKEDEIQLKKKEEYRRTVAAIKSERQPSSWEKFKKYLHII